ncbi:hypothetical protein FACS1894132_14020 [Clostridia bacterium]|nr:hypothetical protein FACS1894132_14020 [Clostridia bacterium]
MLKLKIRKFVAIVICLLLISCSNEKPDGKDYLFTVSVLSNPDTLDPQLAKNSSAFDVISNLFLGIMTYDEDGQLCTGVAESYTISPNGLEYTFTLGENFWYGKNITEPIPLIADDFVFSAQRKRLDYVNSVTAVDEKTVKYILDTPNYDFLTMLTLPVAMPCSRQLFEDCKGRYGLDEDSIPSNGSFFVEKWQFDPYGKDNVIYTKRNKFNKNIAPSRLNYRILESYDDIKQRFLTDKEVSIVKLNSQPKEFIDYKYFSILNKTIGLVVNDNKLGEILANTTVRSEQSAYGIIPPAIQFKGKSYRELVNEKSVSKYDFQKAKQLKENYEVTNDIAILTCIDIIDTSLLYSFKAEYEKILECQISFEIVDYDEYLKRVKNLDYTICIKTISAEYNSPYAFLKQFGDFPISDDADKYAEKEAEIVASGLFIPLFYSTTYFYYKNNLDKFVFVPYNEQLLFRYARNYSE